MTLMVTLHDNKEAALLARAEAQGLSAEEFAARVLDRELNAPALPAGAQPRRHISEIVRNIWSDVTPESWPDMPTDGASEHDHYIYGTPKQNA